jgi:ABC-type polysaccharide/polyol phosphate export permease
MTPEYALPEPTVYEPTVTGLPPLVEYTRTVAERRPLMWHLARTDLKAEHYGTVFGQIWIILDPLLLAAVYYMLRTVVRPIGNSNPATRNLILSHLMWALFFFRYTSQSFAAGSRSVINGKALILNTSVPRAIFPLVSTLKALLDFLPTLLIYAIFQFVLKQPFTWALLAIPLIIVILTIFNLGLAFAFAAITVFFRDTTGFVPYMTQIWLYTTPILYRVAEIPPNLKRLLMLNPLFPFIAALEQIFTGHWPSLIYIYWAAAWALGVFCVGVVIFLVRERDFAISL